MKLSTGSIQKFRKNNNLPQDTFILRESSLPSINKKFYNIDTKTYDKIKLGNSYGKN